VGAETRVAKYRDWIADSVEYLEGKPLVRDDKEREDKVRMWLRHVAIDNYYRYSSWSHYHFFGSIDTAIVDILRGMGTKTYI
jgi:hypothetical protein